MALSLEAGSWSGLLRAAARGLLEAGGLESRPRGRRRTADVDLRGGSREELLVDWVNELIFRAWTEGWAPMDVRFAPSGARRIRAGLRGPRLRPGDLSSEVKAASYHGLRVSRRGGRWAATLILDV